MFDMLMDQICPDTPTKRLLFADMVSLFWELGRNRDWEGAILNIYRPSALETALRETHRSRASVGDASVLIGIARREAEEWRTDPEKRQVLDARPAEHAGVGMMTVHQFERDGSQPRRATQDVVRRL
jgi:hypothetical protein